MTLFKYAFIGAGPATLAALDNLDPEDAVASVVLEAGKVSRQICPKLKDHSCSSCSDALCPVLNGVGGASYGFGNKICEFPASMHVANGATSAEVHSAKTALSTSFAGNELLPMENSFSVHTGFPNRKHYQAHIALADQYRGVLDKISERAFTSAALYSEFAVSDIEFVSDEFLITSATGQRTRAENVIIATGRSGHSLIRQVLPKLGVEVSENLADVGFRIRTRTSNFAENFFYQNDPKYKFNFGDLGSARTFCACKGGLIVPVKFGSGFFADGAFVRKVTDFTNVALMARSNKRVSSGALEDWCRSINDSNNHSLVLGSFKCDTMTDAQVTSSIKELMPTGLSPEHDTILGTLVSLLVDSNRVKLLSSKGERQGVVDILGPSIDRYWPRVEMDAPLLKQGRLSVIGDAAGESRGIYQALVAGTLWGQRRNSIDFEQNASPLKHTTVKR